MFACSFLLQSLSTRTPLRSVANLVVSERPLASVVTEAHCRQGEANQDLLGQLLHGRECATISTNDKVPVGLVQQALHGP